MPQTFQVLRCFKCAVFQVHPTKKSNKWKCKLCGDKQSIKRFYGIGTGKECRVHVQKLNGIRGEINNAMSAMCEDLDASIDIDSLEKNETNHKSAIKTSKWLDYLDTSHKAEKLDDTCPDKVEILIQKPKKMPRKSLIKSNEPSFLSEKYVCPITTKCIDSVSNNNIIESVQPTLDHFINVPSTLHTKTDYHINFKNSVLNQSVQNSKWVQFMEDQICNKEESDTSGSYSRKEIKPIASLFEEDADLDVVLKL